MSFGNYIFNSSGTIFNALEKIEKNKKGFLIINDDNKRIIGTMTDGDIRRALLSGEKLESDIKHIYNKNFKYIYRNDDFGDIIEIFKSTRINFIPILNEDYTLMNIITKKNMHVLLLENIEFDMTYDFLSLDDSILEHEIYNKPWGFYKTTFLNPYSQSKIIKINPLEELSLQEHKKREEYWVVIKGLGEIIIGESVKSVSSGSFIYIPKGCKHKLINKSEEDSLMVAEVQLGEYFGEDDIIRYEDKYGRV
ncbi:CBS domain-containing protein [Proteiniborus sp. MB09-C3]|uniref:CBS domain-containing protein n=1 Tax=Proteiniborus sp. MB09-C3 TaxID=3050072 RepID=UPI002556FD56|nr:CBS domain-containing protein [Proteiniborus sp. MB09-C3]WIV12040.1 CBS domain-containing protein [Proteiniborus sp. MB09-C3]